MKKIISLGIASAVLAISAVSAFADAADSATTTYAVNITFDKTEAVAGDTITATVTAGAGANFEDISGTFTFEGVTLVAGTTADQVTANSKGTAVFNEGTNALVVANSSAYAEGDVLATLPLTVVGDGESATVGFTPDADYAGTTVTGGTFTIGAPVESTTTTESEPVSEPTSEPVSEPTSEPVASEPVSEPTSEPVASEPVASEPVASEPVASEPTTPENPGTGVALAVVPAIIAGAAVVVAKKRK